MRPTTTEREITSIGRRHLYGIISPPIYKIRKGKPYHGLNCSQKCDTPTQKQPTIGRANKSS
jgi:hypothetical protein